MTGVTIPAHVHLAMVEKYRAEYEKVFGATSDAVRSYAQSELVDKYAQDIRFWETRIPVLDPSALPDINVICAHAITTNAVLQMKDLSTKRGILDRVMQRRSELDAHEVRSE